MSRELTPANRRIGPLLIVALSLCLQPLQGNAQNQNENLRAGKKYQDWQAVCEKMPVPGQEGQAASAPPDTEVCFIVQGATHEQSGEQISQVAIGNTPNTNEPFIQVRINPKVGIFVRAGLELRVGEGEPLRFNYEFCGPRGCQATSKITQALLESLRKGRDAAISMHNGRQVVKIPVSLLGFTAGYASLKN